jgi:four helix bundle protein
MSSRIDNHKRLDTYQNAMKGVMEIFHLTKRFPPEERFSLVDQIRRSSRSVCANLGEAWRKRRYRAAFIAKLNDAESEACETQVWIEIARHCNYLTTDESAALDDLYDHITAQLVRMIDDPRKWLICGDVMDER